MPRENVKHLELKYTSVSYEMLRTCEPNEIALYCAIKLHAINKDRAWPSYSTFQKILGWSNDRISLTIRTMVQSRRLVITKRSGNSTVYDITAYDRLANSLSTTSPETGEPPLRKPDRYLSGNRRETTRKERLENQRGGATRTRPGKLVEKNHGLRRVLTQDESERLTLGILP